MPAHRLRPSHAASRAARPRSTARRCVRHPAPSATTLAALTVSMLSAGIARARPAAAQYTVTITQQAGGTVLASGTGSLDLNTLVVNGGGGAIDALNPAIAQVITGVPGPYTGYLGASAMTPFGTGGFASAISASGTLAGGNNAAGQFTFYVPVGYTSFAPLAGTATFAGTYASLGLTPGTYRTTWDGGAGSFTVVVQAPVTTPEPSTWVLFGLGLLGISGLAMRRRIHGGNARREDVSTAAPVRQLNPPSQSLPRPARLRVGPLASAAPHASIGMPLRRAVAVVVPALVPALLGAQYGPSALRVDGALLGCNSSSGGWQQSPQTQFITTCATPNAPGASGSSYSMASFTTLRASAALAGTGATVSLGGVIQRGAYATATTHETFTFNGGLPAFARMYFAIDGTQSGGVPGNGYQSESEFQLQTSWNSGGGAVITSGKYGYGYGYSVNGSQYYDFTGGAWTGGANGSVTYRVVGAVNTFDMYMFAGVNLYQYSDGASPSSLYAISNYGSTGRVVGLQFFDARGNDVTMSTQFVAASGTAYALGAPNVTAAPEPSTWGTVGGGLLAVAGFVRRRARTVA